MKIIHTYTPGEQPENCHYGPNYCAIISGPSGLLCGLLESETESEAQAEALRDAPQCLAIVALHHCAYNIAPSRQTLADWCLEAAAAELGQNYAVQSATL